jgi:hypothetical protein
VHLADSESDHAVESAEGDHYLSVAECNEYYKLLKAPAAVNPIDESVVSSIKSQEEADTYFRDADDSFTREFKVVVETPTQTVNRSDFFIRVYFPTRHVVKRVQFLKVLPFLDDYQKAMLVAFMHQYYALATSETFVVNERHKLFCEAVGDDPTSRTELQEKDKQQMALENPDLFVGSFIYSDADKQVMRYDPKSALDRDTIMVVHP